MTTCPTSPWVFLKDTHQKFRKARALQLDRFCNKIANTDRDPPSAGVRLMRRTRTSKLFSLMSTTHETPWTDGPSQKLANYLPPTSAGLPCCRCAKCKHDRRIHCFSAERERCCQNFGDHDISLSGQTLRHKSWRKRAHPSLWRAARRENGQHNSEMKEPREGPGLHDASEIIVA